MPESSSTAVEFTLTLPVALHARPAGALVRATATFDAEVELCAGERTANARGVLGVLGLDAAAGSIVIIRCTGPDAEQAARAAVEILSTAE